MLKFGLMLSNWWPYGLLDIVKGVSLAEDLGYDLLMISDHFMNPYGEKMNLQDDTLEAWTVLGYLAGKTTRIKLGTCVTPIPLRHPYTLAKRVTTVDILSNGRVIFGVGTGWIHREFKAFNQSFDSRVRLEQTEEGTELIKRLWLHDKVTFEGKYYRTDGALVEPRPIQKPHPPIWVGSITSKRLQRFAAEVCDGWIPWSRTLTDYADGVKRIRKYASKAGRAGGIVLAMAMPLVPVEMETVGLPLSHQPPPNLTVRRSVKFLEQYREIGLEYFVPNFYPSKHALSLIKQFAEQVIPCF